MQTDVKARKVLALFNPKSGVWFNLSEVLLSLGETWDVEGINLCYQESKSPEDGRLKTLRAIEDGVDTIIVVGGDGMVHTIGAELVGKNIALAVIPAGSGNGFARHFGIPLSPSQAARVLYNGRRTKIDVGFINEKPFFVTASLAWDADMVKGLQASPIRGILPYVFAGIYHFFTYEPQHFNIILDGKTIRIDNPLLMTVANLTQFGGGAKIAPDAKADDGELVLVVVPHMEAIELIPKLHKLFDGSINSVSEIRTWNFKKMSVDRSRSGPIQMDGELVSAAKDLSIEVRQKTLEVIIPSVPESQRRKWSEE